ncbi:SGNH/GDSL hydrolase family protein [Smaragdicoccus niigatensis]|nr:SGNH/GDSL hydrolase family protein [Smaragdicoccus niigatensis]
MGDSFASGEGTGDYYPGTDTGADTCHRSPHAYGPQVAQTNGLDLTFVACSGAATWDIVHPNQSDPEPAQISQLSSDTKLVTLTVGGNDVGFTQVLGACLHGTGIPNFDKNANGTDYGYGCKGNLKLRAVVTTRERALGGGAGASAPGPVTRSIVALKNVLGQIHAAAPSAKITVVGYPKLFGTSKSNYFTKKYSPAPGASVSGSFCDVGNTPGVWSVQYEDALWMDSETQNVNAILAKSVSDAGRAGNFSAVFADPTPVFDGHSFCGGKSNWINPIHLDGSTPWSGSFHPTIDGQSAYAQLLTPTVTG